jgi:hypothetical protein
MTRPAWRLLTPEEQAESEQRCGARPTPHSLARCEEKPEHWKGPGEINIHAGRTPGGYWKFWDVADAERSAPEAGEQAPS